MTCDEFIDYLKKQICQPYVLGGQHLELTPDNYINVITKREKDVDHRDDAIEYCRNLFEHGAEVLYAYDCSGLGMYWLQNVKHIFKYDMSANGMKGKCEIADAPKRGYWVFRISNGKATHIGYMISDTEVVHAKGRAYGVVKEKYRSTYWHAIGKPKCFSFDEERFIFTRVLKYSCVGQDVIELKKLLIAHGFDKGITIDKTSSKRFGTNTKKMVKAFQRSVDIKVDGIAGHDTIIALGGVWLG